MERRRLVVLMIWRIYPLSNTYEGSIQERPDDAKWYLNQYIQNSHMFSSNVTIQAFPETIHSASETFVGLQESNIQLSKTASMPSESTFLPDGLFGLVPLFTIKQQSTHD